MRLAEGSDSPELNPLLKDAILHHAGVSKGQDRSNLGGWHSEAGGLEFCGTAGAWLVRHMGEMIEEATFRLYAEYGRPQEALNWSLST